MTTVAEGGHDLPLLLLDRVYRYSRAPGPEPRTAAPGADRRLLLPPTPPFPTRAGAITWLQRQALAQARLKYGKGVKASIGRCGSLRILCNSLRIPRSAVRWLDDDTRLSEVKAAAWAELAATYELVSPPAALPRTSPRVFPGGQAAEAIEARREPLYRIPVTEHHATEEKKLTTIVIVAVVVYAAFQVGAGHAHARHYRSRGLAPSVYWRAGMRGSLGQRPAAGRVPGWPPGPSIPGPAGKTTIPVAAKGAQAGKGGTAAAMIITLTTISD